MCGHCCDVIILLLPWPSKLYRKRIEGTTRLQSRRLFGLMQVPASAFAAFGRLRRAMDKFAKELPLKMKHAMTCAVLCIVFGTAGQLGVRK